MSEQENNNTTNQEEPLSSEAHDEQEKQVIEVEQSAADEEGGFPEGPGFMGLYTTLMLLLMTFFIVLVSMSTASSEKFQESKRSINTTFNVMGMSGSKEVLYFMHSVLKIKSIKIKEALDLYEYSEQKKQHRLDKKEEKLFSENDGLSKTQASKLNRWITLGFDVAVPTEYQEYVTLTLPQHTIFKNGTAQLFDISRKKLINFLNMTGSNYSKIVVRSYCFEKPIEGMGLSTPLELSLLRASTVASLIKEIQDVGDVKIDAIGFGKFYDDERNISENKNDMLELYIYGLWNNTEDSIAA